jgi:uncharacterized paraquat-inducible protein A
MPLPCARCDTILPEWELARGDLAVCTACGSENQVRTFPAILGAPESPSRPDAAAEGEAACYDHPSKRAVAACTQCGRFVCQLCSVDLGQGVWCPSCVAAGAGSARTVKLETYRDLYDSMALTLPVASLLLWPLAPLAALASLVLTGMRWKRPLSLVRRNRWRFVAAIVFSLVDVVGITWVVIYAFLKGRGAAS